MITTLIVIALLLTLLVAMLLPFGGWGSGMDAAGQGMAAVVPMFFMLIRFLCLVTAAIWLASAGGLDWTRLPPFVSGLLAVLLIGAMGGLSLVSVTLLTNSPRSDGRGMFAFLSAVAAPVVVIVWLMAERYDAHDAQAWAVRGVVLAAALAPIPLWLRILRNDAAERRAEEAEEAAETAKAEAHAATLAPGATLLEMFRFKDAIPDELHRARQMISDRIDALPDKQAQLIALHHDPDFETRIYAGLNNNGLYSHHATPAYYAAVLPTIEQIAADLEAGTLPPEELERRARAAIRLAWPAIHSANLPQALMQRLAAVMAKAPADTPLYHMQHDTQILAQYVTG